MVRCPKRHFLVPNLLQSCSAGEGCGNSMKNVTVIYKGMIETVPKLYNIQMISCNTSSHYIASWLIIIRIQNDKSNNSTHSYVLFCTRIAKNGSIFLLLILTFLGS